MLAAAAVGFYVLYLLLFPPVISHISNVNLSPGVVHQGETIHISANYCKTASAVSTIIRTIESYKDPNVVVPYTFLSSNAPVGCGKFEFDTILPAQMTPGKYVLDFSLIYQSDPLRTTTETIYSEPFTVVK